MRIIQGFIITISLIEFGLSGCNPSSKELYAKRIADSIRKTDSIDMLRAEQQNNNKEIITQRTKISNTISIENIAQCEFIKYHEDKSYSPTVFLFTFSVKNDTPYKFSSLVIDGEVLFIMKDGTSETYNAKWDDSANNIFFKNVQPGELKNVSYRIYCNQELERTPDTLTLFVTCEATSVDAEINDTIKTYSILPLWIESQKKYGYR